MNYNTTYDTTIKNRLTSRKTTDPRTGCWLYNGALNSNGYGHISYKGRDEYAHRVSAVLFLNYALDDPLCVMHSCDTPACFNPAHLGIGTQAENMRQAAERGRMGAYKLTSDQAGRIKTRLARGETYQALSTEFGVSTTAIGQIARGVTWKDVPPVAVDEIDTDGYEEE